MEWNASCIKLFFSLYVGSDDSIPILSPHLSRSGCNFLLRADTMDCNRWFSVVKSTYSSSDGFFGYSDASNCLASTAFWFHSGDDS
eukprot:4543421-Ditylum_brightwellii.AAC.1